MSSLGDHYRAHITSSKLLSDPEVLLTDPQGFGVTEATPLQRAIAWVMCCGHCPDRLWEHPDVQEAFGTVRPRPLNEMGVFAGIRGGKTILAALCVVFATQNIDLSKGRGKHLIRGEVPRVSIVSVSKDQAESAYNYIRGAVEGSPALRSLLVDKPTVDTITLRHPSGRAMEICVVAGSKAGSSLVGRWCAGVIFDEAPLMSLEDEGLVNIRDMVTNVRPRMLAGAKILLIGSPWGNDGFVYNFCTENFGKPDQKAIVVKARGDKLNPVAWTPEEQEELKAKDERSYRVNFLAEFMDPESAMYSSFAVDQAMAEGYAVKPPEHGKTYTAAIDPGFVSNSWTFCIAETVDNVRYEVVLAMQWTGNGKEPLVAGNVFDEMLPYLHAYRCQQSVRTDQYAAPPLIEIALSKGIGLSSITITRANKYKLYSSVGVRLDSGYLTLPRNQELRSDLLNVKKRVSSEGGFKVTLPETNDGRHCDYAATLAILCGDYLEASAEVQKRTEQAKIVEDPDDVDWTIRPDEEEYDNRDYA